MCNELRLDWAAHTLIMRRMKDAIDAATRVRCARWRPLRCCLSLRGSGIALEQGAGCTGTPLLPLPCEQRGGCALHSLAHSPPLHAWPPPPQDLAAGKAQVVAAPTVPLAAEPPSRMPRVVRPNEQQRAAMRKALLARQPFADGGSEGQQGIEASAVDSLLPAATEASGVGVKTEGGDAAAAAADQGDAAMKQEEGGSQGAAAAAVAVAEAAEAEAAAEADEEAADEEAADGAGEGEEADGEPEVVELQQMWQQEGGSSEEDMPDLPMDDE